MFFKVSLLQGLFHPLKLFVQKTRQHWWLKKPCQVSQNDGSDGTATLQLASELFKKDKIQMIINNTKGPHNVKVQYISIIQFEKGKVYPRQFQAWMKVNWEIIRVTCPILYNPLTLQIQDAQLKQQLQ